MKNLKLPNSPVIAIWSAVSSYKFLALTSDPCSMRIFTTSMQPKNQNWLDHTSLKIFLLDATIYLELPSLAAKWSAVWLNHPLALTFAPRSIKSFTNSGLSEMVVGVKKQQVFLFDFKRHYYFLKQREE